MSSLIVSLCEILIPGTLIIVTASLRWLLWLLRLLVLMLLTWVLRGRWLLLLLLVESALLLLPMVRLEAASALPPVPLLFLLTITRLSSCPTAEHLRELFEILHEI